MSNRRKQVKPLKRPLCPQTTELPEGWCKVEKIREKGESKGMKDVYLYSPTGRKFTSNKKVQLHIRFQKQKVYMPNVFSKYYGVQKDNAPVNVGEGSGKKVPKNAPVNVGEGSGKKVPENAPVNVGEGSGKKVPKNAPVNVGEGSGKKVPENAPVNVGEGSGKKVPENAPVNVGEGSGKKVPENAPVNVGEGSGKKVPENAPVNVGEGSGKKVPENAPVNVGEGSGKKVPENAPVNVGEGSGKKVPENAPVNVGEGSGKKVPKNATELPEGWRKVEKIRMKGKSKGKKDVYLYSPTGQKFSSNKKVQLHIMEQKQMVYMPNVFSKYYGVQKDNAPVNVGEGSGKKVPKNGNAKKD